MAMKLHRGRIWIALLLCLFLLINPLMGPAALVFASPDRSGVEGLHKLEGSHQSAASSFFASTTSFFAPMLKKNDQYASGDFAKDLEALTENGAFDPMMQTLGGFVAEMLKDERLENGLTQMLTEVEQDEATAAASVEDTIVKILRDERLAVILGEIIADNLKDESLITFLETITADIAVLLQDDIFKNYLKDAAIGILHGEELGGLLVDFLEILEKFPNDLIQNLLDDERVDAVIADATELFLDPLDNMLDELLVDPRVTAAKERIMSQIENLPDEFNQALQEDPHFNQAMDDMVAAFVGPLSSVVGEIVQNFVEEEFFDTMVEDLLAQLQAEVSFQEVLAILERLQEDLDGVLAQIGTDVNTLIDNYPPDDGTWDLIGELSKPVEDHVAEFIPYWADTAAWVFGQKSADLSFVFAEYTGTDSPYIKAISDAADQAINSALSEFTGVVSAVAEKHMAGFDLDAVIDETMNTLEQEIQAALNEFPREDLIALVSSRQEILIVVLRELLGNFNFASLIGGAAESKLMNDALQDIVIEIPFSSVAELITEEDIISMIDGLFALINDLPLDTVAAKLQENADEWGFAAASMLLNGIADTIKPADKNEEPTLAGADPEKEARRREIINSLFSEENLRKLYLSLGGTDVSVITGDSTWVSVITAVISEIANKEGRFDELIDNLNRRYLGEEPEEPLLEEIIGYGKNMGVVVMDFVDRLLTPLNRLFDPVRLLFNFDEAEEERLLAMLDEDRVSGSLRWAGSMTADFLIKSGLGEAIDHTTRDFFATNIVQDIAAPERFSAMAQFLAGVVGSEELKNLEAEYLAADFIATANEEVSNMREMIAELIGSAENLDEINRQLDEMLAELIPGWPTEQIVISREYFALSEDEAVDRIIAEIEKYRTAIGENLDDLLEQGTALPEQFLADERTKAAINDILAFPAEPAADLVIGLLERLSESGVITNAVNQALEPMLQVAVGIVNEKDMEGNLVLEKAMENLIVSILADQGIHQAVGNLVGSLLADPELHQILEDALNESRRYAVNWAGDPHPDAPDFTNTPPEAMPFPFKTVWVLFVPVIPADFQEGANNGLKAFTEVLLEWLRGDFREEAPSEFMRGYFSEYLTEDRVRNDLAAPVAQMTTGIIKETVESEDLRQFILERVEVILAEDPLSKVAASLREGDRLQRLIEDSLAALPRPVEELAAAIREDENLSGYMKEFIELFALRPMDEIIGYIGGEGNAAIKRVLDSVSVEIDLKPLLPFVRINPEIPQMLQETVNAFPAGRIAAFLEEEDRAHRLGYTVIDTPARFVVNLLDNTTLTGYPGELIGEWIDGAEYTLAQRIFSALARVAGDDTLADNVAGIITGNLRTAYESFKKFMQSGSFELPAGPGSIAVDERFAQNNPDSIATDEITLVPADEFARDNLIYGDADGNGIINVADAILVLRHVVGLIDLQTATGLPAGAFERAKMMAGNDKLSVLDAVAILRYVVSN